MRLLITQTDSSSRDLIGGDSLSVFLNVTMRDCYIHIFYGFRTQDTNHIIIDQMVFNYAHSIWILQDNTIIREDGKRQRPMPI